MAGNSVIGLICTAESVRAILAGTKTQTRRLIKPQPEPGPPGFVRWESSRYDNGDGVRYLHTNPEAAAKLMVRACPYGAPGDALWVRETHRYVRGCGTDLGTDPGWHVIVRYKADDTRLHQEVTREQWNRTIIPITERWRSSIHMTLWASRLLLEVTEIRVERLHGISESDAKAEGADPIKEHVPTARYAFRYMWDYINYKRAPWDSNPWVWVISFRRLT